MKKNKSYYFLLPFLKSYFTIARFNIRLKNTYIFPKIEGERVLYLEYKYPENPVNFLNFEETIFKSELFIKTIENNENTVYCLKFPEEYNEVYDLFLEGKYSEFTEENKTIILEYWTEVNFGIVSASKFLLKLNQILYKHTMLKKELEENLNVVLPDNAELASIYNDKKEKYGNKI